MAILHALPLLALAVGQAAPGADPVPEAPAASSQEVQVPFAPPPLVPPLPKEPPPPKPPPPMKVQEGAPVLRVGRPSRCLEREIGGRWRAQCDPEAKTCLVAPEAELTADGEPIASLARIPACAAPAWREAELVAEGYAMIPALAETPPGWQRDDRQRIMQVNFDLGRRIWLGAGYAYGWLPGSGGGEVTAGVRWEIPFQLRGARALARARALETFASFDGDQVDVTAVGLDFSRAYPSPLLRFTTFVGKRRRFDPPLFAGGWVEAVRVETVRTDAGWYDRVGIGAAALTTDLWRSRDLSTFVRLRGGMGYEIAEQLTGGAWVPHAALDADVMLDRDGFQHLRLVAMQEWILPTEQDGYQPDDPAKPRLPDHRTRFTTKAEYELILVAVNDQPISTVLDVRTWKRNDVPGFSSGWEFQGTASLRVNLWAPPRHDAPRQEKL